MRKKTSQFAYERIKKKLSPRQMMVFTKIHSIPGITIRETALKLETFPHCISARFTELEEMGVIKTDGTKKFAGNNQPHSRYYINKKKVKV
jgi:predicted transcriptional regulator